MQMEPQMNTVSARWDRSPPQKATYCCSPHRTLQLVPTQLEETRASVTLAIQAEGVTRKFGIERGWTGSTPQLLASKYTLPQNSYHKTETSMTRSRFQQKQARKSVKTAPHHQQREPPPSQ